jgi:hypothetical protein
MSANDIRVDYLRNGGYRSGRLVAEDGGLFNEADYWRVMRDFDPVWQTAMNGASILSITSSVNSEFYYYGLNVPEGREFVLFARILTLGEGAYEVDAVTCDDGFTGGTEAYKTTLRFGAPTAVQSSLYAGVTPGGALTVRDVDFIDSGTGVGSARASASTEREGLLRVFGEGNKGLLRVKRNQDVNYTANIRMVCWERDA